MDCVLFPHHPGATASGRRACAPGFDVGERHGTVINACGIKLVICRSDGWKGATRFIYSAAV